MPKQVYEDGGVTVWWNQAVHTDREVTENGPGIIIKHKKRENMHTERCGNICRQKFCAKGSGKEVKIQECRCRDKINLKTEMYNYTSKNWSHWYINEKLKEKFASYARKTFDRFTTKDSYTWNIAHNAESTAV
jgi:hypothetical protein